MKYILTLVLMVGFTTVIMGQDNETVKWYSVDEIEKLLAENPKPVLIDTYTDWCSWCKEYDKKTFSDPVIAKYMNDNFYPVKFNAESTKSVKFLGTEYKNDGKYGKSHPLAVALLNGRMSYPTLVFLDETGAIVSPVPGYNPPKDFEPILVFFKDKIYQKLRYEDFLKTFKGSF